ncbi:hypothetical protein EVAR_38950_1 [Eumeta japonica]|uniref:Uncharacterized protein n=1 Tax=Eumeta variegata TaxID=151549 RepID=A0A4C1WA04_EUMVA|nr:hypothetical protein EVAR_38950_1 [Eumeta japonica]
MRQERSGQRHVEEAQGFVPTGEQTHRLFVQSVSRRPVFRVSGGHGSQLDHKNRHYTKKQHPLSLSGRTHNDDIPIALRLFFVGRRACGSSESRWSPPPMDIRNPGGGRRAWPAFYTHICISQLIVTTVAHATNFLVSIESGIMQQNNYPRSYRAAHKRRNPAGSLALQFLFFLPTQLGVDSGNLQRLLVNSSSLGLGTKHTCDTFAFSGSRSLSGERNSITFWVHNAAAGARAQVPARPARAGGCAPGRFPVRRLYSAFSEVGVGRHLPTCVRFQRPPARAAARGREIEEIIAGLANRPTARSAKIFEVNSTFGNTVDARSSELCPENNNFLRKKLLIFICNHKYLDT